MLLTSSARCGGSFFWNRPSNSRVPTCPGTGASSQLDRPEENSQANTGSSRGRGPDQGVPGRAEQAAGGAVQAQPFADHRAGLPDRVLVVVARSAGTTPGRRVPVVEIVGRDDLVETLRAAVGVAVEELAHDIFRAQLGAHRSSSLTAGTAGSSRARMLGRVVMPVVPFVPGLARAPRASGSTT